nr:cobalt-precorrin-5B (C(1))-methyltransferase CbiD [uncultured Peptostreptococcus sp.]
MEEYVYVDGKKYKRGYTTGSCAAAATKAALAMLLLKNTLDTIEISTPKGIDLKIAVDNVQIGEDYAVCSVKKDGGDDIDVTHEMDIFSKVEIISEENIPEFCAAKKLDYMEVTSAKGIGKVTKKGLSVEVGRPAINPIPLEMISYEVEKVVEDSDIDIEEFLKGKKLLVTIYAPEGEKIAKNTFNSNLGIEGGISIIGSSGIVEPMSDEGWKKALSAELSIKREEGKKEIILVPGNIGYEKMVNIFQADPNSIVKMSNFIGYMLMECKRMKFKKITIAGHIGKLIKLSAGISNTHSRIADARVEIMIANLALMGASKEMLIKIESCLTTDAMVDIIKEYKMEAVFDILAQKAANRAWKYLRDGKEDIGIEVYMFSMCGELLGQGSKNII